MGVLAEAAPVLPRTTDTPRRAPRPAADAAPRDPRQTPPPRDPAAGGRQAPTSTGTATRFPHSVHEPS
jgi:hypothetical protein